MAKNFEANAHSIFAGSYERFLFGHSYGPNFSTSFTAAGEEEFEKKSNDTKFLCTIDAHQQSIKSIAAAGPFFCSGGHDDRIRAFHVNTRGGDFGRGVVDGTQWDGDVHRVCQAQYLWKV